MKKAMKKLMAALLAVAMVCAMAIPAFADGSSSTSTAAVTRYTITAPKNGHTYEIYQIFTGDYDASQPSMLANIKWGKNGTGKAGDAVEQTVLDALSNVASYTSDNNKLTVIEKYIDLSTAPLVTITNGGTANDVVGGYYLIKDQDGTVPSSETYTPYIVSVVSDVTIKPKSNEVPKFTKKLKDTNDSTGDVSGWQDSADYDIDDKIPFRLQGTVSKDYDSYSKYYYAFHDVEEKGLTFDPDSVKVFVGDEVNGTKIDASNYTVVTNPADGCTFEIVFDDLKKVTGVTVTAKSIITVTYESTLNGNAVLGEHGNVNTAKLEYSNNPYGDGKGETPWDNVIVFTYKVVVNKVDQNRQPLEGAEFTLTKKTKNGPDVVKTMIIDGSNKALFTLSGLDDGEYTLTETVTPAHYNTISPITFTVTADHKIDWDSISTRDDVLTSLSGDKKVGEITFSVDKTAGTLTTNVINKIGTTLPGTGGIGTTIFYVIGGGLMVAAAILLITKKRMENR